MGRGPIDMETAREDIEILRSQLREHGLANLPPETQALLSMTSGMSHDISNLMAAVLGNVAILRKEVAFPAAAEARLRAVEQAAESAGFLVRRMLGYLEPSHDPATLSLNQIVLEVLVPEEQRLAPRIHIERHVDPDLWDIEGDYSLLTQLLTQLVTNAIESVEGTGRVIIRTSNFELRDGARSHRALLTPGRYVLLVVEDNGHGMDAKALDRVFAPDFSSKGDGRGQGLAAAYSIVKNHGGYIVFNSEPGVGTACQVYLPALPAAATSPPAASREPARGRETVLVVDDNETLLDVLQETLRRLGYRTLRATNGREAVQIAQSYKGDIHVTLLDMAMPVMGGAEAYPLLKETRPNMRIIICTGVHTDPQAEQLLKSGVDSILHKPFRPTTLAQAIRDALSGQAVAGEPA